VGKRFAQVRGRTWCFVPVSRLTLILITNMRSHKLPDSQKSSVHRTDGWAVKKNREMPPEYEELEIRDILDRNEHIDQTIVVSKLPRLPVLCGACRSTVFPTYPSFREVVRLRPPTADPVQPMSDFL